MADYKIQLGVQLDTDDIANQIRRITTNERIDIGINLDTRDVRNQINNIRRQIQDIGNIRINLGGNIHGGNGINNIGREISNSFGSVRTTINNARSDISHFRRSLSNLNFNRSSIDAITSDLERMNLVISNVTSNFRNNRLNVTVTGTDELGRAVRLIREYDETGRHVGAGTRISQDFDTGARAARELQENLDRLRNTARQMQTLEVDIFKLDSNSNANEIRILESQLNSLRETYDRLLSTINLNDPNLSVGQVQDLNAIFVETENRLSRLEAKFSDTRTSLANGIKLKLVDGTFKNDIINIESKFGNLSNKSKELQGDIGKVRTAMSQMVNAAKTGDIEGLINANERYERALKNVENQLKINTRLERDAASAQKLADDRSSFQFGIDAWLTKNSAAAKKFGSQMLNLKAQAQSCDRVTLNHLKNEFKKLDKEADAAGLKMQTLGDRIKTQFSKYSSYFSVASLFMYGFQGLRDMFNQVVAIDTAMTELKKVTDETEASYNQFLSNAASRSKELGTTIDGLVNSTADFARLGYGFKESQGLAEVANIYAVVGDEIENVDEATKSLISTLAAYKDETSGISNEDFAMDIIDKFNEVSNNFAISSGGIGEAMQRSASSLRAANNTIDESIALITAA